MGQKEIIIHESIKLFSLNGFLSTGISDIIAATDSSKGGFYYHFSSKEDLFYEALAEAQRIWREKTLEGLNQIDNPVDKIIQLLVNYKDNYLKDSENFPGGCIFITFSVELDDQRPHLVQEVNKGFIGLKNMLKKLLEEGKETRQLREDVNTNKATEMIFSGMIGTSVLYGVDKSTTNLDRSINSLIDYVDDLAQ